MRLDKYANTQFQIQNKISLYYIYPALFQIYISEIMTNKKKKERTELITDQMIYYYYCEFIYARAIKRFNRERKFRNFTLA
jgi:hypothetical protein